MFTAQGTKQHILQPTEELVMLKAKHVKEGAYKKEANDGRLVFIGKGAAILDRLANLITEAFELACIHYQFQKQPKALKLRLHPCTDRVACDDGCYLSVALFLDHAHELIVDLIATILKHHCQVVIVKPSCLFE